MIGFETLEIVISLVFVYLLFSTLVTLLVEYVSSIFAIRAKNLKKVIQRALDDEDNTAFSERFYKHPMIKYLAKTKKKLPSYIGSDKFAKVVLDLIRTEGEVDKVGKFSSLNQKNLSQAIEDIPILGEETKGLLQSFAKEANEDINDFGRRIEAWFNETVERGQGWFNRYIKALTFGISIVIAIGLNVNTLRIYKTLSENSDLRTQVAGSAATYLKDTAADTATQTALPDSTVLAMQQAQDKLAKFYEKQLVVNTNALALGWDRQSESYPFESAGNFFRALLGWIITALAISLGAPFWFGLLNNLMALRGAGRAQSSEESSKRTSFQVKLDDSNREH
ncbi:hypothetical protein BFP72_07495 [Reichenbachiella sp. 5M10]|uniref:hypothetical protein n=1 Tax=Reichenbachiella sp. 5M10 TaxID=1889772 RepID=UPI000C146BD2|nr:hypothetical protein [Reichenbachiella sp. 5M10]PIB35250.1 hypothetical protein BFP72_07495 [Reichenbachiella sp. 5M10]